jgi:sugar (pentulose or hexulose) kinase
MPEGRARGKARGIDREGLLLGIDLGTTVLKVCAFAREGGALLASAARRLPVVELPDGGREQPMGSLDRALGDCLRAVRERLGRKWRTVRGVGIAAQGGSSIIASRATGRPLTPMILWNDGRTRAHAADLERRQPPARWRRRSLGAAPPAGLGRLLWLREGRPELFREENIHIGAGEYLFFALTGVWRQDAGNAIQIGSYDAARERLEPGLLDLVGVPLSFVAPLRRGHETAPLSRRGARRLGLDEGIPVAGPYIDQEAGYLSAVGVTRSLPSGRRGSSPSELVLPAPVGRGRLVVQPLLAGNRTWDWALGTFGGAEPLRTAARAFGRALLPARGLTLVPWLTLPNPLEPSAQGSGALLGLSDRTSAEDVLRAAACGLSFELLRVLASVRDGGLVDGVVLGGGASKGPWFRTLIAALFEPLPVLHARDEDSGVARGALFALDPRVARSRSRRVEPPPPAVGERVRERYEAYRAVFERFCGRVAAGRPYVVARTS